MALADELVILFNLHKSGGITESEFQTLKTRMIKENPREVAKIANAQRNSANLSPLQVGAVAAASTIGTRMIMDHLKSDRNLQQQVEKLQSDISDLESADSVSHLQVTEYEYQSTEVDTDFDFG
jgi:hypothetical protein